MVVKHYMFKKLYMLIFLTCKTLHENDSKNTICNRNFKQILRKYVYFYQFYSKMIVKTKHTICNHELVLILRKYRHFEQFH